MKVQPILPLPADLLEKMAATQQNPRYHREGNVLDHTAYVLQQYETLKDRFELSDEEHTILYWAAILHDIGKTATTIFQEKRWRSPGHERAGVPFAQDILMQNEGISAPVRHKILDLVRWHGIPLRMSMGQYDLNDIKLLGTRTDLRLLSIFSIFDFEGRDCDDKPETLDKIYNFHEILVPKVEFETGKFAELSETHSKWNLRHKNAAWNALKMKNVSFIEKLREAAPVQVEPSYGKKVTIVMGEALAGKSTWLEQNRPDAFVVSMAEHGFLEQDIINEYLLGRKLVEFKHHLTIYINRNRHVYLETRNLPENWRHRIAEIVKEMKIELEYVVVEASLKTLHDRRDQQPEPREALDLDARYHALDLIHPWEAHATTYVTI